MRSGCSLPATVMLLLFLGVSAWGTRHWKPSIICDNSSLGWICNDSADMGSGFSWLGGSKKGSDASDHDSDRGSEPDHASNGSTQAHALPWPIADKPRTWSNFRKVAVVAAPAAVAATGIAHAFPWPIADKPRTWSNFRKTPKSKKIVAKTAKYKTVAHPFPWPIAKAPRKWSNFRAAPKAASTGIAHGFPWPIAKAPRKWSNFRASSAPPARKASDCGAELNRVAQGGVILFESGSAKLTSSSYDTLDQLAGVAKTCDRVNIVVEGHTDDRGSAGFNQGLSERRAQSVAAYLQGAGVASGSLSAVGYGESRPAVPNTSAANLARNRRIEFSVSGQ